MIQREWTDQRRDAAFLSKALPADAFWSAIDIGTAGSARAGMLRKARGVKAGLPDFLIVYRAITLWIERKSGSALSQPQRMTRNALVANGHRWALAKSTEDIEAALLSAGIPLRASLGAIRERIAEQNERLPPKRKRSTRNTTAPLNAMSLAAYRKLNARGIL